MYEKKDNVTPTCMCEDHSITVVEICLGQKIPKSPEDISILIILYTRFQRINMLSLCKVFKSDLRFILLYMHYS